MTQDSEFSDDPIGDAVALLLGVPDDKHVDMYAERWLLPLNPEGLSPPDSLGEADLRASCQTILNTYIRELKRQEENPLPKTTKQRLEDISPRARNLSVLLNELSHDEIRVLFGVDLEPDTEEFQKIRSLTEALSLADTPEGSRFSDGVNSIKDERLGRQLAALAELADLAWKRFSRFTKTRPSRLLSFIDSSAETRLVMMSGQLFSYVSVRITASDGGYFDRFLNILRSAAGVDTSSASSFSNRITKFKEQRQDCIFRARELADTLIGTPFAPGLTKEHLQTPVGETMERLRLGLGTFLSLVGTVEKRPELIEKYGEKRVIAADELLRSFDALNGKPVWTSDQ